MSSGFYFLPIVLALSALCWRDGSRFAVWLAAVAVVLNVALIYFEHRQFLSLGRRWYAGRPRVGVAKGVHETNLPEAHLSESERVNIRAQSERLRYPRRVTVQQVLRRPDNGATRAADSGQAEKQCSGPRNAVPTQAREVA